MANDEVSIDFTTEELLVLSEVLELDPPPGVGVESLAELAIANNEDLLRASATRALVDRGVMESETVVDPVVEVMNTLCNPGVMIAASSEVDGIVETRFLAAMPEISVEHQGLSMSLHRLVPFASRDLLARTLTFVDLRPYEPEHSISFAVDEDLLDAVADLIDEHDHDAAAGRLVTAGVDEADAHAFVRAMTMKHSSSSVTILHKPEPEQVEGGALSWIDAGIAGLWVTELETPSDDVTDDDEKLELTLKSAREIAADLLSYLPDAFGEYGLAL